MNTKHEGHSVRRAWTRAGLLLLAATTLNGSLWALPFPRSFYEDFPLPGREWVSTLGPYDEHLVRAHDPVRHQAVCSLPALERALGWAPRRASRCCMRAEGSRSARASSMSRSSGRILQAASSERRRSGRCRRCSRQ